MLLFFVPGKLMFSLVCRRLLFPLRSSLNLLRIFVRLSLLFILGFIPYFLVRGRLARLNVSDSRRSQILFEIYCRYVHRVV